MPKNIHWKTDRNGTTTGYWRAFPFGYTAGSSPSDVPRVWYLLKSGVTHADIEKIVRQHQDDNGGFNAIKPFLDRVKVDFMGGAQKLLDRLGDGTGNRTPGGAAGGDLTGKADGRTGTGGRGPGGGAARRPPSGGSQGTGQRPKPPAASGGTSARSSGGRRDWRGHRSSALNEAAANVEAAQAKFTRALEKQRDVASDADAKSEEIAALRRNLQQLGIDADKIDTEIKRLRALMQRARPIKDLLQKVKPTLDTLRKVYATGLRETTLADLPYAQRKPSAHHPSTGGDPVSLFDGAFLSDETDVSLPGRMFPLALSRHYSNQIYCKGAFGWKWASWIDATAREVATGSVYLWMGDGSGYFVTRDEAGEYRQPDGLDWALTKQNGRFRLIDVTGSIQSFDAAGRIAKFEDRFGNWIEITRDRQGRATRLTSREGRVLTLNYNGDQVATVTDPLGRVWRYTHDGTGALTEVALPATADLPDGRKTTYVYGARSDPRTFFQIIGVEDHTGIRVLENTYGAADETFNRVTTQVEAGKTSRFTYTAVDPPADRPANVNVAARTTTLTGPDGVKTRHVYSIRGALLRTEIRPTTSAAWDIRDTHSYDGDGNRIRTTQPKGNATELTYDTQAADPLRRRNVIATKEIPFDGQNPKETLIVYGPFNQVSEVTRPDGVKTRSTFSPDGLPVETGLPPLTDETGAEIHPKVTSSFNSHGQPVEVTMPGGQAIRYVYTDTGPGTGTLAEVYVNGVLDRAHTYDAAGRVTETRDGGGTVFHFAYDALDQVIEVNGAPDTGMAMRFTYDPRGLITERAIRNVDELGQPRSPEWRKTRHSYDSEGREIQRSQDITKTDTAITRFRYNDAGQIVSMISPEGTETVQTYDHLGQLTDIVLAPGTVFDGRSAHIRFAYDANGNQTSKTDPLGRVEETTYDGFDRPSRARDAAGNTLQFTWDALDRTTALDARDAGGVLRAAKTFRYDNQGNTVEVRDRVFAADGTPGPWRAAQTAFDSSGRPVAVTGPGGAPIRHVYDANDQITRITDAMGNVTRYEWTESGQVAVEHLELVDPTSSTGKRHFVSRFGYDTFGRQIWAEDALGNRKRFAYDGDDAVVRITHADGTEEHFERDLLGRVTRHRIGPAGAAGHVTSYRHDAEGNITHVTDARGKTTQYRYDALGRQISLILPDGTVQTTHRYDAAGNLVERRDARGMVEALQYDRRDRLVRRDIQALPGVEGLRAERFAYDYYGYLTEAENDDHRLTCEYDSLGRLQSEAVDGHMYRMSYGSTLMAEQLSYPGGFGLRYDWDTFGRLASVDPVWPNSGIVAGTPTASSGPLAQFSYMGTETPVQTAMSNGAIQTARYDAAGRMASLDIAKGGATLEAFDLVRDPRGQIRASLRAGVTAAAHDYDAAGRLVESRSATPVATRPSLTGWAAPETAGPVGQSQSALDLLAGQLDPGATASRTVRYALDAAGNRQSVATTQVGATTTETYASDDANRYTQIDSQTLRYDAVGNLINDGTHAYFYDHANRLIRVQDLNTQTDVLVRSYDPLGRVATKRDAQGLRRLGHIGLNLIEERDATNSPLRRVVNGPGIDAPIAIFDTQSRFPIADPAGSIVASLDKDGKLVARGASDPFGQDLGPIGGLPSPATAETADFQGRPRLGGLGLHDFRSRIYAPAQGRFVQTDTIGQAGGLNLYQFAAGDPLMFGDPMGTAPAQRGMAGRSGPGVPAPYLATRRGWAAFFGGFLNGALLSAAPFLAMGTMMGQMQGAGVSSAVRGTRTGSDIWSELVQLHNMLNPVVAIPMMGWKFMTTNDQSERGEILGGLVGGSILMIGGRLGGIFKSFRKKMQGRPKVDGYEHFKPQDTLTQLPEPPQNRRLTYSELYRLAQEVRYGDYVFLTDDLSYRHNGMRAALHAGREAELAIIGKDNVGTAPVAIVREFETARTRMQDAGINVTSITDLHNSQYGYTWSPPAGLRNNRNFSAWSPSLNYAWMEGIVQTRAAVIIPHELQVFIRQPNRGIRDIGFLVHEVEFFRSRGYTIHRSNTFGRYIMLPPPP